jgi:hypothetical protein
MLGRRVKAGDSVQVTLYCRGRNGQGNSGLTGLEDLATSSREHCCQGLQAVWLVGDSAFQFYDGDRNLLRTVSLEGEPMKKAA